MNEERSVEIEVAGAVVKAPLCVKVNLTVATFVEARAHCTRCDRVFVVSSDQTLTRGDPGEQALDQARSHECLPRQFLHRDAPFTGA